MRRFLEFVEKRYLRHLPYILGAATFLVCTAFLATAIMHIRASRPTTEPISDTASIIVFEHEKCGDRCDQFRKSIGRPHQGSDLVDQLPLRYYDITDSPPPRGYQLSGGIRSSPTAVVFDIYGREQARIDWMPKDLEDFQSRMMPHVRRGARDFEFATARGVNHN